MTQVAFWRFVWLAGVRLPLSVLPVWQAVPMGAWGCVVLIVARYTGFNLATARVTLDAKRKRR